MAVLEIPLRSDIENYSFTTTLEGKRYGFGFHFNARMAKWIFDVNQNDGTAIVSGIPVYVGMLPLARYRNELLPPGTIIFIDTAGGNVDPGEDDLGSRVSMMYIESTEVF